MMIDEANLYRAKTSYVKWLLGIAAVVVIILVYFRLPSNEDEVIVIVEPRQIVVDPAFEALIEKDLMKVVADFGKWGQPALLEDINAGEDGVAEMKKRFAINVNVSDRIPYSRELPDARPHQCRNQKDLKNRYRRLPRASIVIVTRNEAWSVIVRTLHSVVDRTPPKLLKEVIIVDDGSTYPGMTYDLVAKLEYYVARKLPQYVRMIRLDKKSGVVPARLRGAKEATGDVLVFLDAHCEVGETWLEPLLERIKKNPQVVVQPVVDIIDYDTFEYSPFISNHYVYNGIVTWAGGFEWLEMSIPDILKRKDPTAPHKNPVMAGGLFAIDRKYFWDIGSYDDQMYDWGFENIEMSIRVWTCGGTMEIIPCSRVGHVFHKHVPEAHLPANRTRTASVAFNVQRTVKVWYDEYDRLIYQFRPSIKEVNPGDITARQAFRRTRQCKPFEWFVTEVLHKFVMDRDAKYSGRLMSDTGFCLTHATVYEASESIPILLPCDYMLTGRQYWALSKNDSSLRREYLCILPHMDRLNNIFGVRARLCDELKPVKWLFHEKNRTLEHLRARECLDSVNGKFPILSPCHPKKPSQKWTFIDNATLNVFGNTGIPSADSSKTIPSVSSSSIFP